MQQNLELNKLLTTIFYFKGSKNINLQLDNFGWL